MFLSTAHEVQTPLLQTLHTATAATVLCVKQFMLFPLTPNAYANGHINGAEIPG